MNNLMKFELRKLFRMKSFYICLLISVFFEVLSVVVSILLNGVAEMPKETILAFDSVFSAIGNGQLEILLAVFISLFVCCDYTEGTIKNIISHGFSRGQVYATTYVVLILAGWIFVISDMAVGFVLTAILGGVGTPASHFVPVLLINFLLVVAYVSLFHFFGVLFRKNGGAIAVGIVFPICLSIAVMVAQALFQKIQLDLSMVQINQCLSKLSGDSVSLKQMGIATLCSVAYIALFGIAGAIVTRKREL